MNFSFHEVREVRRISPRAQRHLEKAAPSFPREKQDRPERTCVDLPRTLDLKITREGWNTVVKATFDLLLTNAESHLD